MTDDEFQTKGSMTTTLTPMTLPMATYSSIFLKFLIMWTIDNVFLSHWTAPMLRKRLL